MKFKRIRGRHARIYGVTWTCKRCGAVFLTQSEYAMHLLMCGS